MSLIPGVQNLIKRIRGIEAQALAAPEEGTAAAAATQVVLTTVTFQPGQKPKLWLGGIRQHPSGLTFTAPATISWGTPLAEATPYLVEVGPISDVSLRSSLASAVASFGAALIGWLQAGTGAVARTVWDVLRDRVSAKDFGAIGDGVSRPLSTRFVSLAAAQAVYPLATTLTEELDRIAIRTAYAAHKGVFFPAGDYYLGDATASDAVIDWDGRGDGMALLTQGRVRFIVNTVGAPGTSQLPRVFRSRGNSHVRIDDCSFKDLGYDPVLTAAGTFRGAWGFYFESAAGVSARNIKIGDIDAETMMGPVALVRGAGSGVNDRIRGVRVGQIFANDCAYPWSQQDQGDGVVVANIHCLQAIRCFFVYGCEGVEASIFNENGRGSTGSLNISRSAGGRNTRDIKVRYRSRNNAIAFTHVNINHIDLLGGEITDVRVDLDTEAGAIYTPVYFVNYNGSGVASAAASPNVVRDVVIAGTCDGAAAPIDTVASYASRGRLVVERGLNLLTSAGTDAAFKVNRQLRNAAIAAWTSTGTAPSLGNGTLVHSVDIVGNIARYVVDLTWGSTTTPGTGYWLFRLADFSATSGCGAAYIFRNGVAHFVGVAMIEQGDRDVRVFGNNTANAIGAGIPHVWATGDTLRFTILIPV